MVTSIIMFKLKEKTDANAALIKEKLMGMKGKIDQLKDIKVQFHLRNNPNSFDAVMIAEYDSLKDFDEYAAHPVHVEAGSFVVGLCEQISSFLYEE